jgi:hypothetical protein
MRLIRKSLHLCRRLLGTAQILEQQGQQLDYSKLQVLYLKQLQQTLLALGNAAKWSSVSQAEVKATIAYKRCKEIVSLLSPMDVQGGEYVRVGGNYDGGYVMFDNLQQKNVAAAYSFGISDDVAWDEAIADRGIDTFMYDHTIDKLPRQHPKFHYWKTGLTGYKKGPGLKTLRELLVENGHASNKSLIMKMDIEGCEWDVFSETASEVIGQFAHFVVEFHGLASAAYDQKRYLSIASVLKKINQTHQSIHVHANSGFGIALRIGGLVLPELLEVTYIRAADVKDRLVSNRRQFPTELDKPTVANWPDIYLGSFSADAS